MGTPVRLRDPVGTAAIVPVAVPADVRVGAAGRDREGHLPVVDELAAMLPEGGLVRGSAIACTGGAAVSVALALAARATRRGSWLALVGVPWVGIEAARELGVALERVVRVDVEPAGPAHIAWAELVAAAADGFELVITQVPSRVPDRLVRQVRQRLRARGGVLVDVRPGPGPGVGPGVGHGPGHGGGRGHRPAAVAGVDLVVATGAGTWEGIDRGSGHLRSRRVDVTVTGRRAPRPVRATWSPGPPRSFRTSR